MAQGSATGNSFRKLALKLAPCFAGTLLRQLSDKGFRGKAPLVGATLPASEPATERLTNWKKVAYPGAQLSPRAPKPFCQPGKTVAGFRGPQVCNLAIGNNWKGKDHWGPWDDSRVGNPFSGNCQKKWVMGRLTGGNQFWKQHWPSDRCACHWKVRCPRGNVTWAPGTGAQELGST